jgi:SulP family sulfate permease
VGCFKLGTLTQFVSRSVLVGYVAGAAIAIFSDQLFFLFGIVETGAPRSLLEKLISFCRHFEHLHVPTSIIGVSCLAFLLMIERINRKIPGGILAIVISGVVVWFWQLSSPEVYPQAVNHDHWQRVAIVSDLGSLGITAPQFAIPYFEFRALNGLLPVAFAIALLGILETSAIARSLASETGQRLSTNQEIFGLGMANTVCAMFGAMPCSASFARSSINFSSGAKTRMAAIMSGVFCALIVAIFRVPLGKIPLAALAALLIASTPRMIKWPELATCFRATRSDAVVLTITLLCCVLFRIDTAFYMGVILSIAFTLKKASTPSVTEYQLTKEGLLRAIGKEGRRADDRIRIIHVEGEIFFGAADLLQETLGTLAQDPEVRVIVLHLKNARQIDATACLVVQQIYRYLRTSGRYLIASGLTLQGWTVFCASGLTEEIGKENLFLNDEQRPHHSSRQAYARAVAILQANAASRLGEEPSNTAFRSIT